MSGVPHDDGRCSACNCTSTSRDLWPFKDKLASYQYQYHQELGLGLGQVAVKNENVVNDVKFEFEVEKPGHLANVNSGVPPKNLDGHSVHETTVIDTKVVDTNVDYGHGLLNGFIDEESALSSSREVLNGLLNQVVLSEAGLTEGSSKSKGNVNVNNQHDQVTLGLSLDKDTERASLHDNDDLDQEVTILDALAQVYQIESKNWIDKENGSLCTDCLGILCLAYKYFQGFLNVSRMGNSSIWKSINNRSSSRNRISSSSKMIKNDISMNGNKDQEEEFPSPEYESIEDFLNESSCDRDQTPTPDFIDFLMDDDNDKDNEPISTLNNYENDRNPTSLTEKCTKTVSIDLFRVDSFEISSRGKIFCPICFHVFTDTPSLRNHIMIHRRLNAKCNICFKQFATLKELETHNRVVKGKCRPLRPSTGTLVCIKIDDAHYDQLLEDLDKIPEKFSKRTSSTSVSNKVNKKVNSPIKRGRPQKTLQKTPSLSLQKPPPSKKPPQKPPQRPQRIIPSSTSTSKPLKMKTEIKIKPKMTSIVQSKSTYKPTISIPIQNLQNQNQRNVNVLRKSLPRSTNAIYCIDLTEDDLKMDSSAVQLKPKLRFNVRPGAGPVSSKSMLNSSSSNNKKTIQQDNERTETEKRKRKPSKVILDDNFVHQESSSDSSSSNSDEDSDSDRDSKVRSKVRRVGSSPFKLRERTKSTSFKEPEDSDSDSDYVNEGPLNAREREDTNVKKTQLYPCSKCGKEFPHEFGVRRHERDVHLQRTCSICTIEFKSVKELEGHRKTVHFPKKKPTGKVVEIINKSVRDINSKSSDVGGDIKSKDSTSSALDEDFNFNINDPRTLSRIGGITLTHSEEVSSYYGNSLPSIQVNNPGQNQNTDNIAVAVDYDDGLDFLDEIDILNKACSPYINPQKIEPQKMPIVPPLKIKLNENRNLKTTLTAQQQQQQQGKSPTATTTTTKKYVPKPKVKKLGDYICKYCDRDFVRKKDLKLHEVEDHFITSAPAKYRPGPKSSKLTTTTTTATAINNSHNLSFLIPQQNQNTTTTMTNYNQNHGQDKGNYENLSTIDLSELGIGFPANHNHNCTEVVDQAEQVVEENIEVEFVDLQVPLTLYAEDTTLFPQANGGIDDFNDLIQF